MLKKWSNSDHTKKDEKINNYPWVLGTINPYTKIQCVFHTKTTVEYFSGGSSPLSTLSLYLTAAEFLPLYCVIAGDTKTRYDPQSRMGYVGG